MDAVTALSGSGPAYVFLLAEAMQAAGVAQGLAPDTARALALQTIHGAARMLLESGDDGRRPAAAGHLARRHHAGGARALRGRRLPRPGRARRSPPPPDAAANCPPPTRTRRHEPAAGPPRPGQRRQRRLRPACPSAASTQCRRLGEWLAGDRARIRCRGLSAACVGTGRPRRRSVAPTPRARLPLPEAEVDAGLDEFDHHAVFDGFARGNPDHEAVLGSRAAAACRRSAR